MSTDIITAGRALVCLGDTVIAVRSVGDILDPRRALGLVPLGEPRMSVLGAMRTETRRARPGHEDVADTARAQIEREHHRLAWLLQLRAEDCHERAARILDWLAELPCSWHHRDGERIVYATRSEIAEIGSMTREMACRSVSEMIDSGRIRPVDSVSGRRLIVPVAGRRAA